MLDGCEYYASVSDNSVSCHVSGPSQKDIYSLHQVDVRVIELEK
jgi:hypothetical protein